jgi:hypothetical protein
MRWECNAPVLRSPRVFGDLGSRFARSRMVGARWRWEPSRTGSRGARSAFLLENHWMRELARDILWLLMTGFEVTLALASIFVIAHAGGVLIAMTPRMNAIEMLRRNQQPTRPSIVVSCSLAASNGLSESLRAGWPLLALRTGDRCIPTTIRTGAATPNAPRSRRP